MKKGPCRCGSVRVVTMRPADDIRLPGGAIGKSVCAACGAYWGWPAKADLQWAPYASEQEERILRRLQGATEGNEPKGEQGRLI